MSCVLQTVSRLTWHANVLSHAESQCLVCCRQCLQKAVEVVESLEKENTNVLIMGKDHLRKLVFYLTRGLAKQILCPDMLFDIFLFA